MQPSVGLRGHSRTLAQRERPVSLLHLRGVPWARIADFVGQKDLTVTANTYTHVMVDEAEVEYRLDERLDELRRDMYEAASKLATEYGCVSPSIDFRQYDPHRRSKGRPEVDPPNPENETD